MWKEDITTFLFKKNKREGEMEAEIRTVKRERKGGWGARGEERGASGSRLENSNVISFV